MPIFRHDFFSQAHKQRETTKAISRSHCCENMGRNASFDIMGVNCCKKSIEGERRIDLSWEAIIHHFGLCWIFLLFLWSLQKKIQIDTKILVKFRSIFEVFEGSILRLFLGFFCRVFRFSESWFSHNIVEHSKVYKGFKMGPKTKLTKILANINKMGVKTQLKEL